MTDMNMNTAGQPDGQKKRLSCVTCNAPLPIGHDGEVQEFPYFASSSKGWKPENEGERDVEDISTLNLHISAVTSAIWDLFKEIELGARKDLDHLKLGILDERHASLEKMRSLCHLLEDLQAEVKRKVNRLGDWVRKEITAEEQEG